MKKKILLAALFFLLCLLGFALYGKQVRAERGRTILNAADNPPLWMLGQIQTDLSSFTKENFSDKSISELYQSLAAKNLLVAKVKIHDGKVSLESSKSDSQADKLLNFLSELASTVSLPNLHCVIYLEGSCGENVEGPLLAFAKKQSTDTILFPNLNAAFEASKIAKAGLASPWESKTSLIFWRGSSHNPLGKKLVELSAKYPKYIDAQFEDGQNIVKPEEQIKNRYLINIDECRTASAWILFSNSLLLKPASEEIQWYSSALIPFENYLPVASDLSDLLDKQEWGEQHPERCKEMAAQASSFAEQSLNFNGVCLYTYLLFQEYALLQRQ